MNKAIYRIELRTDKQNKNGSNSLFLYARINGKRKYFSLNVSINSEYWNKYKQRVSTKCDNWNTINAKIESYLSKASQLVQYANLEGRKLEFHELDEALRISKFDRNNVFEFIDNYISAFGSRFSRGTIDNYKVQSKKLSEFKKNLSFQDINPFFWHQFETHLINIGNNPNTIYKSFKTLKVFIHRAIEQGIIKFDPLKGVTVKKSEGKMLFLTMNEIEALEKLYKGYLTSDLKRTLHYFLFACYTGLRYSDIRELKHKHIIDNELIVKEIYKTSSTLRIPLSERAKKLIPNMVLSEKPIFQVYSNQVTNRHLKSIMKLAKIDKKISFHCARHSFATITLQLSNDIAAVSKLLGHSKIQMTMLYAKVIDDQKISAVKKWDAVS